MMNEPMNENEIEMAKEALARWFESQDIVPADGVAIMARLIKSLIYSIAKNRKEEKRGLALVIKMFEAA